jgi:hypothetical protein
MTAPPKLPFVPSPLAQHRSFLPLSPICVDRPYTFSNPFIHSSIKQHTPLTATTLHTPHNHTLSAAPQYRKSLTHFTTYNDLFLRPNTSQQHTPHPIYLLLTLKGAHAKSDCPHRSTHFFFTTRPLDSQSKCGVDSNKMHVLSMCFSIRFPSADSTSPYPTMQSGKVYPSIARGPNGSRVEAKQPPSRRAAFLCVIRAHIYENVFLCSVILVTWKSYDETVSSYLLC